MTDELPPLRSDTGIVGLTLNCLGEFDPASLSRVLPFEVAVAVRKGELRRQRLGSGPNFHPTDYLKVLLDDSNGLAAGIDQLAAAVASFDQTARLIWSSLERRTVSAGLTVVDGTLVFDHCFPASTVAQLASIGAELVVGVYCVPEAP